MTLQLVADNTATHPIAKGARVHVQQFGHGLVRRHDAVDNRYDVLMDDGSTIIEVPHQMIEAR